MVGSGLVWQSTASQHCSTVFSQFSSMSLLQIKGVANSSDVVEVIKAENVINSGGGFVIKGFFCLYPIHYCPQQMLS